ncbi:MAG: phosphomannomutase/phosphoglucomutase [bacterium]
MKINREIFRKYDIRGIVSKDMDNKFARHLGRAFATYIAKKGASLKTVSVGYDARETSPVFAEELIKGLNESGVNTVGIGLVPTGLLYFTLFTSEVDGGIQVTASHNPSEYNGFKINYGDLPVYGDDIQLIGDIMEKEDYHLSDMPGTHIERNVIPQFEDFVFENINIKDAQKLKVVIDSGNGTGGFVAVPILKKMGIDVTSIFEEPDGNFPNHHPDPTVEANLQDLISEVRKKSADIGIGYDGDADRIGVVDKRGNIIWGDSILTLFARDLLKKHKGVTVIGDVKCSKTFVDDVRKHGGNPVLYKAGHSLIKAYMKETGALLGGEMSGHIFIKDRFFGYDCSIYVTLRLLEIVSREKNRDISALLSDIPETFASPEIRTEIPEKKKVPVVEKLVNYFKNNGYDVNDIDGARITFDDGWALMRASNTQNVIVFRFEADTKSRLEEIRSLVEKKFEEFLEEV